MPADDLTKPLGLDGPKRRQGFPLLPAALGILVVAGSGAMMWLTATAEHGDAPVAVAKIDAPAAPAAPSPETTGAIKPAASPALPADGPGLIEVTPDGAIDEVGDGEVTISDPGDPGPIRLASAADPGLVEKTAQGSLPRVGDDGTRPLDAYARPSEAPVGATRIAIIVGGIGVSPATTEAAIAALPGTVTLAIAPYGSNLKQVLGDARAAGHEVLLQLPLEPFDYPENDPGPHTLVTSAAPEENLDNLHWLLARTSTYVGVINYMGGRFLGDADALAPVIADIGQRGLLYVDDGAAGNSRAADVAKGKAPFLRADVVIDANADTAAIDASLKQLVAIARQRGFAIGSAGALPLSIQRIQAFAKRAAENGITLVPVSALAKASRT